MLFVDTSAFLAMLSAKDPNHRWAQPFWAEQIEQETQLICTSYVLVETLALVQQRSGLDAVRGFENDVWPFLQIVWVDEDLHHGAMRALLGANRRQLSLVDCMSFEVMRRLGLRDVFVFDRHFVEQGFNCLPMRRA